MTKLKMHSLDLAEENVVRLAGLFPNCVTEAVGEDGQSTKKIDFDQLKQELSASIVDGPRERYQLDWPGKKHALLSANIPVARTLRPCRAESVQFDSTKNIFIEGDNLDALKLLQETYLNKVKMIYIDPPYNTGKQFIYNDKFFEETASYFERSLQKDENEGQLVANTESNGRFHSDWLSMMYSRLRIAKNLLREDGFIFLSIDDHEVANLKKICDEIFGEGNFRGQISRVTGTPSGQGYDILVNEVDYILVYSSSPEGSLLGLPFAENDRKIYDQKDERGRYLTRPLRKTGGEDRREDRPTMYYGIKSPDGDLVYPVGPGGYKSRWRCGQDKYKRMQVDGLIAWKKSTEESATTWKPYQKFYLEGRTKQPSNLWQGIEGNKKASIDIKNLFGAKVFDSPKPVDLLLRCLQISTTKDDIILDFFAGSSTTAHAVMEMNAQDGGSRRYIMVQLPQVCDPASEAFKAGYPSIAEVSKERIRRAGNQIIDQQKESTRGLDIGFRVLKVDSSNMKDVYYAPNGVKQGDLLDQIENIKEDRTPEDLLFQVLIDWGVDLSLPIAEETIDGKTVFFVDNNALVACFETDINEELVKTLAAHKPLRAVFCDSGYGSDSVKINVEQIFKLISPSTEVKSI